MAVVRRGDPARAVAPQREGFVAYWVVIVIGLGSSTIVSWPTH